MKKKLSLILAIVLCGAMLFAYNVFADTGEKATPPQVDGEITNGEVSNDFQGGAIPDEDVYCECYLCHKDYYDELKSKKKITDEKYAEIQEKICECYECHKEHYDELFKEEVIDEDTYNKIKGNACECDICHYEMTFTFNPESLSDTIPVLSTGMLGIFIVTGIIIAIVLILNLILELIEKKKKK